LAIGNTLPKVSPLPFQSFKPITDIFLLDADPKTLARDMILSTVDDPSSYREFAETIQRIVTGVSFTAEKENPEKVKQLIAEIPELAIVQVRTYYPSSVL